MTDPYLINRRVLRRLREEGRDWARRRDEAIRMAGAKGMSLREIGAEVGMSHAGVDKIIKESRVQDGNSGQ